MTLLQTMACGSTDMPPMIAPEPFIERQAGAYICREYPMLVARVREIRRKRAGEIVRYG